MVPTRKCYPMFQSQVNHETATTAAFIPEDSNTEKEGRWKRKKEDPVKDDYPALGDEGPAKAPVAVASASHPTTRDLFSTKIGKFQTAQNGSGYTESIVNKLLELGKGRCFICMVAFVSRQGTKSSNVTNCRRDHQMEWGHANVLLCHICNTGQGGDN